MISIKIIQFENIFYRMLPNLFEMILKFKFFGIDNFCFFGFYFQNCCYEYDNFKQSILYSYLFCCKDINRVDLKFNIRFN